MPRSAKDIQLTELKDTIAKLNELIMTQTKSMDSLQKTIEDLRQELSTSGLNPQKYLEYLLEARPNKNMSDEELENMAPWNPKIQECCVNRS